MVERSVAEMWRSTYSTILIGEDCGTLTIGRRSTNLMEMNRTEPV